MRTVSGFIFVGLAVFAGSFLFGNLLSVMLLREALPPIPSPQPFPIMESAFLPTAGGGAEREAGTDTTSGDAGRYRGLTPRQPQIRILATKASSTLTQPVPNAALASPSIEDEVQAVLASWVGSIRTKDLRAHMSHYGPLLDTYYTRNNVSWASIYRDKNRFLTAYRRVVEYRIDNVTVSPRSSDEAVVEFEKWWDFRTRDGRRFAGKDLQRLELRRIDGPLRIVSEENLSVHWIIRQ